MALTDDTPAFHKNRPLPDADEMAWNVHKLATSGLMTPVSPEPVSFEGPDECMADIEQAIAESGSE